MDPLLANMAKNKSLAMNFTSLADLFGSKVGEVTVRDLASMRSGIPDFDTATERPGQTPTDSFRATVLKQPDHDFTPPEIMSLPWVAKGSLRFTPGTNFEYSTTNFIILGLVLCAVDDQCSTWDDYDQRAFANAAVRAKLADTNFGAHGAPADFGAVHGFDRTNYNGHDASSLPGTDFWKVHGTFAGWTGSDVVMPVADAAEVAYATYAKDGGLLSAASQAEMQVQNMSSHGFYTFATMNLGFQTGQEGNKYGEAWGHLGATYGYDSTLMYFPALGFSMAIGSDTETSSQSQVQDAACVAYNRVKNFVLGEKVDACSISKSSYFAKCSCASNPGTEKYRCASFFGKKFCHASYFGTESRDSCEKSCK